MPLPLPSSKVEQDIFYKLFQGGKSAIEGVQNWYQNTVPNDVRRNISDIIDTPIPGNPVMAGKGILQGGDAIFEAATAFPLIVKAIKSGRLAGNTARLAEKIQKVFKINPAEVRVNRYQQEPFRFPVSLGNRGGVFFSHGEEYPGYVVSGVGSPEGGENVVKLKLPVKNPLYLKRGNDFIGPEIIHTLMPKKTAVPQKVGEAGHVTSISDSQKLLEEINKVSYDPNVEEAYNRTKFLKKLLPLFNVKQAREARAGGTALQEAVASALLRSQGYDSAVSLRYNPGSTYTELPRKTLELKEKLLKSGRMFWGDPFSAQPPPVFNYDYSKHPKFDLKDATSIPGIDEWVTGSHRRFLRRIAEKAPELYDKIKKYYSMTGSLPPRAYVPGGYYHQGNWYNINNPLQKYYKGPTENIVKDWSDLRYDIFPLLDKLDQRYTTREPGSWQPTQWFYVEPKRIKRWRDTYFKHTHKDKFGFTGSQPALSSAEITKLSNDYPGLDVQTLQMLPPMQQATWANIFSKGKPQDWTPALADLINETIANAFNSSK